MAINETRMPEREMRSVEARPARGLNAIDWIALALTIIGGLNWGLVGLFNIDLVAALLGQLTTPSRAVYVLVGLGALWSIAMAIRLGSDSRLKT